MGKRAEFSKKVKLACWQRSGGHCEKCGSKIVPGNGPEYHHIVEAGVGGSNDIDNCQVLCIKPCHATITATESNPRVKKSTRVFEKRIGARKGRGFPKRPPGTRFDWSMRRYVKD